MRLEPIVYSALLLSFARIAAGQRPAADSVARRRAADSARAAAAQLPAVEIHGSIVPTAGPAISSGVPAQVSVVSGGDVAAWRPRILPDVLGAQAGVSLYDDLGTPWKLNLSSRGFTAGPTVGLPPGLTIFLDGVRQNEADAQEVNFDLLPTEDLARVEMLSGTATLLGPNSLGGAINLVTSRGGGPASGSIETSGGSFGALSVRAGAAGSASGWDYYVAGGGGGENGWRQATSDHSYDALANVGKGSASRGVRFQLHAARSRAATAGSLPESIFDTEPRVNFTPGDFEDLNTQQLSMSAFSPVAAGNGSLTLYARRSDAERFNVNQVPDPNVRGFTKNYTAGTTADWRWTDAAGPGTLALRGGVDAAANSVRVRIYNEAQDGGGSAATDLTTDVRSPSWETAGYILGDYRVGRLTLSGGGRADYVRVPFRNLLDPGADAASGFSHLSPRGGASVDLGGGALMYLSVGESFRAPAILELSCADPDAACPLPFALGDDPPLAPVTARTYEAGARWARGPVVLNGSLYRTDVHNEIFFIASPGALLSGYFRNLGRTRRVGAELAAQGDAAGGRLGWYANYAFTRATFESPAQIFSIRSDDAFSGSPLAGANTVTAGDELPLVPNHQAKAGGSVRLSRFLSVGLDARYVGTQWLRGDEANETGRLPAHTLLNGRVSVAAMGWQIAAVVDNALDSRRAIFGTFNENRRTGELERFLTPMNARTLRLQLRRQFGRGASED